MPLTDTVIKEAKPDAKPIKLSDGKGLYLLVNPVGSKLWRWKYRVLGKEKAMSLGAYPDVSLAQAREGLDKARKLLAGGDVITPWPNARPTRWQIARLLRTPSKPWRASGGRTGSPRAANNTPDK